MSKHHKIRSALLSAQGHRCAICLRPIDGNGALDHDHAISQRLTLASVRGVLCNGCNSGLGQFRDDAAALTRAVDYLKPAKLTNRPLSLRAADLQLEDEIRPRPPLLRIEDLPREIRYALLAIDVRRTKTLLGEWHPTPEEELEVTRPEFRDALSIALQLAGYMPRATPKTTTGQVGETKP